MSPAGERGGDGTKADKEGEEGRKSWREVLEPAEEERGSKL